ncbi:MAG: hypothetical protein WBB45_20690 [Cyclobacteriaceae bacterium]
MKDKLKLSDLAVKSFVVPDPAAIRAGLRIADVKTEQTEIDCTSEHVPCTDYRDCEVAQEPVSA